MDIKKRIADALDQLLANTPLFVVEIRISSAKTNGKVTIVLDGDEGVGIDNCVEVSRKLGNLLEEENLIENAYVLEVTSAGADTPLKLQRQYPRHIGRILKIEMKDGSSKVGELTGVTAESLSLNHEEKDKKKKITVIPTEIPLSDIKSAQVEIRFK